MTDPRAALPHPKMPSPTRDGQDGTFCTFCGRRLIESTSLVGYSPRNGKAVYAKRKDCPLVLT